MASIKFNESSLRRFILMQIKIMSNLVPSAMVVCGHMKGSDNLSKGKYSSWTQWWEENIIKPIVPSDKKCPCCQRLINEDKSNYFIIGHIVDIKNDTGYLCPICNECNVKMKKWRFLVNKNRLVELPTDL